MNNMKIAFFVATTAAATAAAVWLLRKRTPPDISPPSPEPEILMPSPSQQIHGPSPVEMPMEKMETVPLEQMEPLEEMEPLEQMDMEMDIVKEATGQASHLILEAETEIVTAAFEFYNDKDKTCDLNFKEEIVTGIDMAASGLYNDKDKTCDLNFKEEMEPLEQMEMDIVKEATGQDSHLILEGETEIVTGIDMAASGFYNDKDKTCDLNFKEERQLERIKREKAQAKHGDDIDPQVRPDHLVPVSRYHGSGLASGAAHSPYHHTGSSYKSGNRVSVKKENQRQSERIKREKAQAKHGDDIDPQVRPDHLVSVCRYQGSELASGADLAPHQHTKFSYKSGNKVSIKKENQRQSERIKHEKAQAKHGDDIDPQVRHDHLVPVSRYQSSGLASGAAYSPHQHTKFSYKSGNKVSVKKENQRQLERIKHEKAEAKHGDDIDPQVRHDHLVPVSRYQSSGLASGAALSPYQHTGSSYKSGAALSPYQHRGSSYKSGNKVSIKKENQVGQTTSAMSVLEIRNKQNGTQEKNGNPPKAVKVPCLLSTPGASVVEAENSLQVEKSDVEQQCQRKTARLLEMEEDIKTALIMSNNQLFVSRNKSENKLQSIEVNRNHQKSPSKNMELRHFELMDDFLEVERHLELMEDFEKMERHLDLMDDILERKRLRLECLSTKSIPKVPRPMGISKRSKQR